MPAYRTSPNNAAFLDNVRHRFGNDRLRDVFHNTANERAEEAAKMLNDKKIQFPSLFVLRPEIQKSNLYAHLNNRNRASFDITEAILADHISPEHRHDRASLQWMLETGYHADGLNEYYDRVLDAVAILLAKEHSDNACKRPIIELIFRRNRKGFYTYDLIWAFFEVSKPKDLLLIADKLRSTHPKDVELARQLLNFVPCLEEERSPALQHRCCVHWIMRNRDRLTYTGESNQQFNNPRRYALSGEDAAGREARP